MKYSLLILFTILLAGSTALAAPSADLEFFDFERASLEDILNIRTAVASRLNSPLREAPGIITVITREEIQNCGARNLVDALRLIPGLDFGVDVESSLGVGVRGNWSLEGKVLFLVDGQHYNEPFFGSSQIMRFPIEQVEKIEVIRGPGSAIYGGFAELGVIKITTRSPKSINGTEAALSYGYMAKTYGGRTGNLAFGKVFEGGELSAQAYYGDFNRSDRRYADFNGGSYSMKDASKIRSRNLNIGLKSRLVDLRLIADLHRTTQQDHYDSTILPRPLPRNYDAYFAEASRIFHPGEKLTLSPSLSYSYQEPFNGYDPVEYPRDKSSHYTEATLTAAYSPSERLKLTGGIELSQDTAILADTTPLLWDAIPMYFKNGKKTIRYSNRAFFAEAVTEYPFGTISAGARYDKHEKFDSAFSPRLAWTKVYDRLHFKAIYSRSFRAPGIDNLEANPDLAPEKTSVIEFEAGYKMTDSLFMSANAFTITIKDPIVYYPLNIAAPYGNYGESGTKGLELTVLLKKEWGYADLNYSYYAATNDGAGFYNPGAGSDTMLGFAPHKFTLNSSFNLARDFTVNPSAAYYSGRRGYSAIGQIRGSEDTLLANIYFSRRNLIGGRMDAGLGVYDILDSGYSYAQPYNGGHSPLPAASREVRARLSYKF